MNDIVLDVSPESLARANEANLIKGFAACARAYGGEVADAPDLLWCATGIPSAGWNRVLRARLAPERMDARIEWVQERARALGTPFLWHIIPSTRPANLDTHLLRHGFTDVGDEPAMGVALARLPSTLPLPEGVRIERVRERTALEQWARTAHAGFGASVEADAPFVAAVSRDTLAGAPAAEYYLALLDGEPVASSALTLAAGVAGIFSVATLEGARRRGIGAAVTMAPLLAARDRGYAVGVLQASEMGYSVYARMGFTEQFRYRSFYWKPE
jgi:GNAT superfamily N-acetyltransferase